MLKRIKRAMRVMRRYMQKMMMKRMRIQLNKR